MDQPVTTFGRRESASESDVGCVLAESNAALVAKEFDRALQIMRAAVAVNDAPELQLRRGVLEVVFGHLGGVGVGARPRQPGRRAWLVRPGAAADRRVRGVRRAGLGAGDRGRLRD